MHSGDADLEILLVPLLGAWRGDGCSEERLCCVPSPWQGRGGSATVSYGSGG